MARTGFDRGPGGTGEGTIDAANYASISQAAMELARAWAQAAVAVEPDATNYPGRFSSYAYSVAAGDSASAALASQTAAAASASAAATSESNAATSASNAATSASNAATSASSASTSASNAATSEANALTYSNNAFAFSSNASTSASNAATSASNAATSASDAAASALAAATSETNAAASAAAAAASAAAAATFDPTNYVAKAGSTMTGKLILSAVTGDNSLAITGAASQIAVKIVQGATAGSALQVLDSTQTYTMTHQPDSTGNYLTYTGAPFILYSAGNRLTLDTSGRMGLGAAPDAWGSGHRNITIGRTGNGIYGNAAGEQCGLTNNAYYNGTNWKYANTALSSILDLSSSGDLGFYSHASGTAGTNITLVDVFKVTAAGNLTAKGNVRGGGAGTMNYASAQLQAYHASNAYAEISNGTKSVLIGADSGTPFIGTYSNHEFVLRANNSERARIVSGTWTTSGWGKGIELQQSYTLRWQKGGSSYSWGMGQSGDGFYLARSTADDGSAAVTYVMQITNAAADAVFVANVTAYSDARFKKDITNNYLTLEDMLKIRPVSFKHVDREYRREVGAIAQEVQQVIPEAVVEDEKGMLSLDYGRAAMVMVASLAKEVDALKSEIERLKK